MMFIVGAAALRILGPPPAYPPGNVPFKASVFRGAMTLSTAMLLTPGNRRRLAAMAQGAGLNHVKFSLQDVGLPSGAADELPAAQGKEDRSAASGADGEGGEGDAAAQKGAEHAAATERAAAGVATAGVTPRLSAVRGESHRSAPSVDDSVESVTTNSELLEMTSGLDRHERVSQNEIGRARESSVTPILEPAHTDASGNAMGGWRSGATGAGRPLTASPPQDDGREITGEPPQSKRFVGGCTAGDESAFASVPSTK